MFVIFFTMSLDLDPPAPLYYLRLEKRSLCPVGHRLGPPEPGRKVFESERYI